MITSNISMYEYLISNKRKDTPVYRLGQVFDKSNISIPNNVRRPYEKAKKSGLFMTHGQIANLFFESHTDDGNIGMNTDDIFYNR